MKEEISQQRCTIGANWYTNNLPENRASKTNVDVVDRSGIATILGNIGTSDHNPVVTQLEISASYDKPYKTKLWCYVKANFWDMRGHFSSILWSALFKDNDNDPKKVCTKITEVICDAMDAYISQANWSPRKQGTK